MDALASQAGEVGETSSLWRNWDFEPEEARQVHLEPEDLYFTEARITGRNVMGCAGLAAMVLVPTAMAVFGKGKVRRAGLVTLAGEAALITIGLEESGF